MTTAQLLTPATNYAVVQLPERAFPGVVFQGDSLNILISDLETAIGEHDLLERAAAFQEILDRLRSVRTHYENTLASHELARPY